MKLLVRFAPFLFLIAALGLYFALLGERGFALISDGRPAVVGLGVGVLLLPIVGAWTVWSTVRAGVSHQRLSRLIAEQGRELDVSALPRRASGRLERVAADELFRQVKAECEDNPYDWQSWYRVARAYDYAGDRKRARETMKRAVEMERGE